MDATAIILAAGEGTRMKSNHCKVSHKILGKPMVQWIVDATIKAGCSRVVVVIGSHADEMRALIDGAYANSTTKVECVEQTERLGTGHAIEHTFEPRFDHFGGADTVDYQHDIVAHQDGGNEEIGLGVEHIQAPGHKATFLHIELGAHAVRRHIGYLDSREESRENQRNYG